MENKILYINMSKSPFTVEGYKKIIDICTRVNKDTIIIRITDTIKIDIPNFGLNRDAMSKQDFKTIDEYAKEKKIKLIPQIEVLEGYSKFLKWDILDNNIRNDNYTLNIASSVSIEIIEKILKYCGEVFSNQEIIINIGQYSKINRFNFYIKSNYIDQDKVLNGYCEFLYKTCEKNNLKIINEITSQRIKENLDNTYITELNLSNFELICKNEEELKKIYTNNYSDTLHVIKFYKTFPQYIYLLWDNPLYQVFLKQNKVDTNLLNEFYVEDNNNNYYLALTNFIIVKTNLQYNLLSNKVVTINEIENAIRHCDIAIKLLRIEWLKAYSINGLAKIQKRFAAIRSSLDEVKYNVENNIEIEMLNEYSEVEIKNQFEYLFFITNKQC